MSSLNQDELDLLKKLIGNFNVSELQQKILISILHDYVHTPICFSTETGTFLWVNTAWARMLEYTPQELINSKVHTWKNLTVESEDLILDEEQVQLLISGQITNTLIVKKYRKKSGGTILTRLTISRFPAQGECIFFVCTAVKIEDSEKELLEQWAEDKIKLLELNKKLYKINKLSVKKIDALIYTIKNTPINILLNKFLVFWEAHPKLTASIVMIMLTMMFSDVSTSVWQKLLTILSKLETLDVNTTPK